MRLRDPRWSLIFGLVIVGSALSGCDNETFAPSNRGAVKASSSGSSNVPVRAKEIVFIFPAEDNEDLRMIESVARPEVGNARAVFSLYRPSPGDPSSKQAELVKRAAAEGVSAIVIVADKSRETAEALAGVDQKKTPIVLLGRAVGGGSYTLVAWPSFTSTAKQIVDAVNADVKKVGLPDDAPVLFLKSDPPDESSAARDAALLEALKATTHLVAAVVPISDESASKPVLAAALKAHPKVCAVIADDSLGLTLASAIRLEMKAQGVFLLAGYCVSPNVMKAITFSQHSMLVDRNVEGLVRKAISAALDRSQGNPLPDRIEIDMPTRRATTTAAAPLPGAK